MAQIFERFILKVMGYEATHAWKDDQLCAGLKARINRTVKRVQSIWEANSINDTWGFYLFMRGTCSTRIIELECCGQSATYDRLELVLFLTFIFTTYLSS